MTEIGSIVLAALAAVILSLVLLRVGPKLVGRFSGGRFLLASLLVGAVGLGWVGFGLVDAQRAICTGSHVDREFHCELGVLPLAAFLASLLVTAATQLPFMYSAATSWWSRHAR
jgi:hypothetical protein